MCPYLHPFIPPYHPPSHSPSIHPTPFPSCYPHFYPSIPRSSSLYPFISTIHLSLPHTLLPSLSLFVHTRTGIDWNPPRMKDTGGQACMLYAAKFSKDGKEIIMLNHLNHQPYLPLLLNISFYYYYHDYYYHR